MVVYDDEELLPAPAVDREVARFLWSLALFAAALWAGSCFFGPGC